MASDQNQDGEIQAGGPVDPPVEVPAAVSDDAWVDVDGKRMRLSALVAEHREMRDRVARVKKDTRMAVTKRRAEKALKPFQAELIGMQKHLEETETRMIVLFEGRDAAGKGGTIRRVTRYMNAKHYPVVALGKPTDHQRTQWFFQRYVEQFPYGGEHPLRQWKLSEINVQAQDRWDDFTRQKYEMLRRTHMSWAPWTIIRSNNKIKARLNAIKAILNAVPYQRGNRELDFVPDSDVVVSGARELEIMEAQMLREGRFTV